MEYPTIDGVSAIALVLFASFAVDRIVTGTIVLLSFLPIWRRTFPDPETLSDPGDHTRAKRRRQVAYFVFAAILAIGVLAGFGQVRLLSAMLGKDVHVILDTLVTGLTLVAGADRIAAFLQLSANARSGKSASRPIEITGRLTLDREPADVQQE